MITSEAPLYNGHLFPVSDGLDKDEIPNWNTWALQKQNTDKQSDPESQPGPVPI